MTQDQSASPKVGVSHRLVAFQWLTANDPLEKKWTIEWLLAYLTAHLGPASGSHTRINNCCCMRWRSGKCRMVLQKGANGGDGHRRASGEPTSLLLNLDEAAGGHIAGVHPITTSEKAGLGIGRFRLS